MKRNLNYFKTPVLKEKEDDFLHLLDELGLDSTVIVNNCSRGDYQLYEIDLSNLDDEKYSNVRASLTSNQTSFL